MACVNNSFRTAFSLNTLIITCIAIITNIYKVICKMQKYMYN